MATDELLGPGAWVGYDAGVQQEAPLHPDRPGPLPVPTGWTLVMGRMSNGKSLTMEMVYPPGVVRRWLTWLVLGWRWTKTPGG